METDRKAYNLLWIPPTYPARRIQGAGEFVQPIKYETIRNIAGICERNPCADVRLWTDSHRLTDDQIGWLEREPNTVSLQDLQNIEEYRTPFYQKEDPNPEWRSDKNSLIWRQVDAARILVCLQGDYSQVFYSDTDITNLTVDSNQVQEPMKTHGLIFSGLFEDDCPLKGFENGLFGFARKNRSFFENLYYKTLEDVQKSSRNGYTVYIDFIYKLRNGLGIEDPKEISFRAAYDGTFASHPQEGN